MQHRKIRTEIKGSGMYEMKVAGVTYYAKNIGLILDDYTPSYNVSRDELVFLVECEATIVSEPENPHDSSAIAVYIKERKVGHLSREIAAYLTIQMAHEGFDGIKATCKAILNCRLSESHESNHSIRLDICLDEQVPESRKNQLIDFEFPLDPPKNDLNEGFAKPGSRVNFWSKPGDPSRIYVYLNDSTSDENRGPVGFVPRQYVLPIYRHLKSRRDYEANLVSKSDCGWIVKGRLETESERLAKIEEWRVQKENWIAERKLQIQADFHKELRPRNAILFDFSLPISTCKKGDRFRVTDLPDLQTLVNAVGANVHFRLLRIRSAIGFDLKMYEDFVLKLCRLQLTRGEVTVTVLRVKSDRSTKQSLVTFEIPPHPRTPSK
jgi:hypothetical protein